MWTLKYEISSPKFYELLIKIELKGYTALDLKNFYKPINMSRNEVTIIKENLLPSYQSIKIHSEFSEYFISYRDHPSYSWNVQIYTSLVHSLLVAMTNDTCVKYSMEHQAYKVFRTNAHEILRCTIISRLLHSRAPHLGGINGYVKSELANMAFKNGEQLGEFHSRILILQQEVILSGEKFSPTRLLFQYTKALSKSYCSRSMR